MSDVFADKIKLSGSLVNKELDIIEVVTSLYKDIKYNKDILESLNEYPAFINAWQNIAQLYYILRHDYIKKVGKKEEKIINDIMLKYETNLELNLNELQTVFNIILKAMAVNKFHDVLRKAEGLAPLKKFNKDKGLEQ